MFPLLQLLHVAAVAGVRDRLVSYLFQIMGLSYARLGQVKLHYRISQQLIFFQKIMYLIHHLLLMKKLSNNPFYINFPISIKSFKITLNFI